MSRQRERLLEAACGLVAAGDWALISHVLPPLATPAQTADRFARLAARVLASEPLPRVDTMPSRSYQRPTKA